MGNIVNPIQQPSDTASLYHQWASISKTTEVQLVQHKLYQYYAQIRVIAIDSKKNINDQIKLYEKRNCLEGPLVECYRFQELQPSSMSFCGNQKMIKVVTEKIEKWKKIKHSNLNFSSILYTVRTALVGYKILHDLIGAFEITENMFGFNYLGELKVWMNQNFASNHVSRERMVLVGSKNDNIELGSTKRGMVRNILDVIRLRVHYQCAPDFDRMRKMMEESGYEDFTSAIKLVDKFIKYECIVLPQRIILENYISSKHSSPNKIRKLSPLVSQRVSFTGLQIISKVQRPSSQPNNKNTYQKYSQPLPIQQIPQHTNQFNEPNTHTRLNMNLQNQQPVYQQLLRNPNINTAESFFKTIGEERQNSSSNFNQKLESMNVFMQNQDFNKSKQILHKPSQKPLINRPKTNITFNYNNGTDSI